MAARSFCSSSEISYPEPVVVSNPVITEPPYMELAGREPAWDPAYEPATERGLTARRTRGLGGLGTPATVEYVDPPGERMRCGWSIRAGSWERR